MRRLLLFSILVAHLAAPATTRAVPDYRIGPEDVLKITVWEHEDLSMSVTVSDRGFITLPLVGDVLAAGLTDKELEKKLVSRFEEFVVQPTVTVTVEDYRSKKAVVWGAVRTPGTFTIAGNATLIELISQAGGPTEAAGDELTLFRASAGGGTESRVLSLKKLLAGSASGSIYVEDGDLLMLEKASFIQVLGEVSNPGPYRLTKGMTVLEAITAAGGFTERASTGKVMLIRIDEEGKQVKQRVRIDRVLDEGLKEHDVEVAPNDVINVPQRLF